MMDRKWMYANRLSEEYMNGVKEFISVAVSHAQDERFIRCPCWKCMNIREVDRVQLYEHLIVDGIDKSYTCWTNHGENRDAGSADQVPFSQGFNIVDEEDDIPSVLDDDDLRDHPQMDDDLKTDAENPLWDGCSNFSKLSAVLTLYNIKAAFQLSDTCFSQILGSVGQMLPGGNMLPRRAYDAKQMLSSIGLTHERIHACRGDCILFRGEYAQLTECPKCNSPRYKKDKSPAKVVWYFPLAARLRRLYSSVEDAKNLTWHDDGRTKDGMMRHPADSPQWKTIDAKYPEFRSDPRNLRLVLSSDGMNPFGVQSTQHSTWPVVLMIYNLPPYLCMKRKYMMLSMLIAGPKQPGNNIDVYLAPLIEDLKLLWENGIEVYDSYRDENFQLRAMLFGTINDFPAYGYLSGYSVKGKTACPLCDDETDHIRLKHCKKEVFLGYRKFLPLAHRYRKMKSAFNGRKEERRAPKILTGRQVYDKVKHLDTKLGQKFAKDVPTKGWKKMSIFFQLPYWKDLQVRHSIDLMHVQKNVFESLMYTLLSITDRTKDGLNARLDLVDMGIRPELAPVEKEAGPPLLPPAAHTLSKKEKKILLETLESVKVPQGYSSNIRSLVSVENLKLRNLKSHDCHVIMNDLLPIAIRSILPEKVRRTVTKLCMFFKAISSKVIDPNKLPNLEKEIVETLCELEMYFPPSFFDIMVHLIVHLVHETRVCGNARMRWMFPVERFMKVLKGYVMNRSRPEGCMAERYLVEEAIEYWTEWIPDVEAIGLPKSRDVNSEGEGVVGGNQIQVSREKLLQAHLCVLQNTEEVQHYVDLHKIEIRKNNARRNESWITKEHSHTFISWFSEHISLQLQENPNSVTERIKWLSGCPRETVFTYRSFLINGYTFCTKDHDAKRTTQNSGVSLVAESLHVSSAKDRNPIWGDMTYFGVVECIWEMDYYNFRVPVFGCNWADNNNGVHIDEMGFTRVDLSKTIVYTADSFIIASHAQQVFYVTDPVDAKWSIVLLSNKLNNLYPVNEDVEVEDDPFMGVSSGDKDKDEDEDGCFYVREDHTEGEYADCLSTQDPKIKNKKKRSRK